MKYIVAIILTIVITSYANSKELVIHVVSPKQLPVADIVVYATPKKGVQNLPVNTTPLMIGQQNKEFAPYITVMQKGQVIHFVNHDDITHHIYSVSGNNRFEFKLKAGDEKQTAPILAAEEIAMGCNIHDWMSGYTLVVNTPYYGKTDLSGNLSLDIPHHGDYVISIWHPQLDLPNNQFDQLVNIDHESSAFNVSLPKKLLPTPMQSGQDEFDFIEEY